MPLAPSKLAMGRDGFPANLLERQDLCKSIIMGVTFTSYVILLDISKSQVFHKESSRREIYTRVKDD
jgi:hypothetical protein